MKNIKSLIVIFSVIILGCQACGIDNYDEPNAGIYGTLIDSETGEAVQTEQPDGARIELMDLAYDNPIPLQFWVKADGTFRNVALFNGKYDVRPYEGPFFPVEAETVTLNGVTKHDFNVTPYLKVKVENIEYGEAGSADVTISYTIKRSTTPAGMEIGTKTISEARVLCNIYPVVSCYNGCFLENCSSTKVLSRSTDTSIEEKVYSDKIKGLESGKKYYVRVAALSSCSYNKSLKRYNYTEVMEITAP
ncbi:MAG: DUF3823 domain-containing protein [Candidatus Homeothermus sp.]|jgi:hypothetical protein|nr:DUF3823 domain-containing protein [Candidatus Homeothermus sp.]PWL58811.1 MAG: hypothetical protein DBY35_11875 [Bacteroidales bacterium]